MVSPSKKRKLEAKTQPKATGVVAVRNTVVTGECRLRRSQKPLSDKKFYLDLKNHISSTRIETRLRSYGAVVDAFLSKEVNYVVTDRPAWSGTVPSSQQRQQSVCTPPWHTTGLFASPSPSTGDSPTDIGARRLLQRSRAGAMLEKARQQQTHLNTIDPLENAVRWKVPIWPVAKVLKWLDKIESSLNNISVKTKQIKSPYIKFEDFSKQYRPVYSTLTTWPTINIDCGESGCPFSIPKSPSARDSKTLNNAPYAMLGQPICDQRMTRKSRMQLPKNEDLVKAKLPAHPGYCEICDKEYPNVQDHIISTSHLKFVQDNKNYQDLDSLIKDGPSVEDLFKVLDPIGCTTRRTPRGAASPPWSAPDSTTDSSDIGDVMKRPLLGNGQLRRSSQRQAEERSKVAARKEINETQMNGISKVHPCKLSSNDRKSAEDDMSHNLRPRLTAIEEPDFKRLRSRNSEGSASLEDSCDSCGDLDANNVRHKTDHARTRQCRNSSGSDSVSNNLRPKRDSDDIVNGKQGSCSEDSTCSVQSTRYSRAKAKIPKKKRLSVEEKLLEDNKEYYKLEVINAKLRSSGYFCNQREIALPENGNDDSGDEQKDDGKCLSARRSRRSELSVLNHEADSYLFGDKSIKKEVSSPVYQNPNQSPLQIHIYTDECANHVPSAPLAERSMLPSIKEELGSPQSNDEGCSDDSPNNNCDGGRKKRRTHAEVFINDNLDYYKFQLPESRLRLHGITSNNPHLPYKTEADGGVSPKYSVPCHSQDCFSPDNIPFSNKANLLTKSESNIIALLADATPEVVDRMKFSFEEIPRSEPWFQTYRRQDEGGEIVEPFSDFELERRYVLPYEIPSENFFTRFGRGRGRGRGGRGMRGIHRGHIRLLPKSRAQQLAAAARNPRKSPRRHASTLAILSSFVNRRLGRRLGVRRQSLGLPREATAGVALPIAASECLPDFQEIEKNLNEMLASSPSSPVQDFGCKPTGRVRRRSQRRATESSKEAGDSSDGHNLEDSDSIDPEIPSNISTSQTCGLNANSDIDVVKLFDEFPKCNCVSDLQVEDQYDITEEEEEAFLRRLECESECTSSTYDTMSETGTNYSSIRGRSKKRKRNLTGWPSAKPKKKKLDAEPADNFVGIRLKKCPVNTRGKMHFTYRPTNSRGRGRVGGGCSRQTLLAEPTRRTRAHLDSHSESSPEKSPSHCGGNSPRGACASTSGDTQDSSRPSRGSSQSPRKRESPRMQGRVRTRWGAPSRRQRC